MHHKMSINELYPNLYLIQCLCVCESLFLKKDKFQKKKKFLKENKFKILTLC